MKLFNNKGFTFIGVIISMSIVTLLAAIALPQFLRSKMIANETSARATLKAISTALESFAAFSQQGTYPTDILDIVTSSPPYLNKNYIADSPVQGYNYTCETLDVTGYSCSAAPEACNQTGSKTYTITTSGVLTEEDCGG